MLSIIAGNTLSLNADIDVTGKGFRGGTSCMGTSICVGTNPTRFDKYAFHRDSLNSGFKGESLVIRGWLAVSDYPAIYPKYAKGKGPSSTGGGGGNGKYSGGGGGGNYGSGGKGGREVINCTGKPVDGGTGGLQIRTTPLAGGLFLGGGGGSSTGLTDISASPGGNGGGIVIILCDTITGNGYRIVADGADASDATDKTGGAGGGGGGGSVALHLRSFTTSGLTISVNGGKGGNSLSTHGEGGGGGGGLINTSNITTPTGIIKNYSGGAVGTRTGASTGGSGTAGENLTTFVPVLNGFLFNSVSSSVNGKQVDTIISNEIPRTLSGTYPAGGSGSYTYIWQKSYINPDAPFTISGVNTSSYTPTDPETTTVWFRRIVTDNATLLSDTSKWLKIVVMIPTQSPQMNFSKNLIMFPNPANDEFEIRLSDQRTGDVEIILTDINGSRKSSWRTVKESEELRYKIPASGFAAGLYHIRLLIDNTPYCSGRVVIVH
ncbi:MAG: hypothetical protein IQL11_16240 [Bacteroidales bacterium]|nr:hypothetical protein [Bacteroidales bacterium]